MLVIGGGNAGKRFVQSCHNQPEFEVALASFDILGKTSSLADAYNVPCISFPTLTEKELLKYDCIAICTPIEAKYSIVERLLSMKYRNSLILEKPLAINDVDLKRILLLLNNIDKAFVCYPREFLDSCFEWPRNKDLKIEWASAFSDMSESIIHSLPHLLDWMLCGGFNDIELVQKKNELVGCADGVNLKIVFNNNPKAISTVNSSVLPKCDPLVLYPRMIKGVVEFTKRDTELSMIKSCCITTIIEQLRRKRIMDLMKLEYEYNDKIIWKEVSDGEETIVIAHDPESGDVYEFNDVGSEIFLMLKDNYKLPQIIDSILDRYDVSFEDIQEDLELIFERFCQLGIINSCNE